MVILYTSNIHAYFSYRTGKVRDRVPMRRKMVHAKNINVKVGLTVLLSVILPFICKFNNLNGHTNIWKNTLPLFLSTCTQMNVTSYSSNYSNYLKILYFNLNLIYMISTEMNTIFHDLNY